MHPGAGARQHTHYRNHSHTLVSGTSLHFVLFCIVLLLWAPSIAFAESVQCIVGSSGDYPSIQAALNECNNGTGDIQLVLNGAFYENLVIPHDITNVSFVSQAYLDGNATKWPLPENITDAVIFGNHRVENPSTAVMLGGVLVDGQDLETPLFIGTLVNNNITMDRCLVQNFAGNVTIQVTACKRAVAARILNSRFKNVWGSALYLEGMEDIEVRSNIFAGCGGLNNYSCTYLKLSFVSEGYYIVSNNSVWLLVDAQPERCVFEADRNAMTRCNNGTLECYNTLETERLRPNCQRVNISYVNEITNAELVALDYPPECRIYRPCRCQGVLFEDLNTTRAFTLAVGDIFFYTGLRLNCTVQNGSTSVNNSAIQYVESLAGADGVGISPPIGDMGWSLGPTLYLSGFINNTMANCSCSTRNRNATLQEAGLECDYMLERNNTFCKNGTVRNCTLNFLRCFPLDETLQLHYGLINSTNATDAYCNNGTSITATNTTVNESVACQIESFLELDPSLSTLLLENYLCIARFDANSTYKVLLRDLSESDTQVICNTTTVFPNGTCPEPTSNITSLNQIRLCESCNTSEPLESVLLLVQVCEPYHCPINHTVRCDYSYFNLVQNASVLATSYSFNYTVIDGVPIDNGAFSNGSSICLVNLATDTNGMYANVTNDICAEQGATPGYRSPDGDYTTYGTIIPSTNETVCYYNATMLLNGTSGCDIIVCMIPEFTMEFNVTRTTVMPYDIEATRCDVNFTCLDFNVTECSCVLEDVLDCLMPYTVGREAAAFHMDNIVNETSMVDVTNNRAQQLYYGLLLDRTTEWKIYNTSVAETEFSTENSALREVIKQGNNLIWGRSHDSQYGLFGNQTDIASYRRYCDGGCAQDYVDINDFDCYVDASTPEPQVNRTYQAIQLAIDDGCRDILVNSFESFYTGKIIFRNRVRRLYSFDDACVLDNGHEIHVANLDLRGMCFLHPGDEPVPLFDLRVDMDNFFIRNCYLDGEGNRGGGVISLGEDKYIKNLVVNHTTIQYWNFATFILWNVGSVIMSHNMFFESTGRVVDIVYNQVARFHDNTLIDVRGIGGIKGVAMVRLSGRGDNYRWMFFDGEGDGACSEQAERDYGYKCGVFHNVQSADVTAEDFQDICFSIIGGGMTTASVFNNFCRKASVGFELRSLVNLTSLEVPQLLARNPGIRPSLFRTTARERDIRDWVYDVYSTDQFAFSRPRRGVSCNFPCGFQSFDICTVNPNYEVGYVGNNPIVINPYGVYENVTVRSHYGWGVFHNASHALDYCVIRRINPHTGGVEYPIYFTGERGGRMFRDSFDIIRPGISFYGALLANGTEKNLPGECFPRSVIYGDGWRLLADNFTTANMSYARDARFVDLGRDMLATFPQLRPVYNVNITNNTFSGEDLPAYGFNCVLKLIMGFDRTTFEADNPQKGGKRPQVYDRVPPSIVIVRNNIFQNFSSFENTLSDPDTGERYNTTLSEFPFTDPLFIWFLDEEKGRAGQAYVDYNTFMDVDRRAADIRYAQNTTFIGNKLIRVGGRFTGNAAGVFIQGNRKLQSFVNVSLNEMNQTKPILSDKTISRVNPAYYASIYVRGYLNGTICILNNTVSGGAIGMRLAGMNYDDLLRCINATQNPPMFYDLQDTLRRVWFNNRNLTGYVHWLVFGEVYQDFPETWLFCDDGCVPAEPQYCNVSLTDPAYVPTHPWWDTRVFRSASRAFVRCDLPERGVRLLPNYPPQDYNLVIDPDYVGNETNCISNSSLVQEIIAFQNDSSNPVRVVGCGHMLRMCRALFRNFIFVHNCGNSSQTWNTNVSVPVSLPTPVLQFRNNTFLGQGTAQPAISGVADDQLQIGYFGANSGKQPFYIAIQTGMVLSPINGNRFYNYTGPRVISLVGRDCSVQINISFNYFDRSPGSCVNVQQVGGIEFDYNTLFNVGAQYLEELASVYINTCTTPNKTRLNWLRARWNRYNVDASFNPLYVNNTEGYHTAYWFDPVQTDKMPIEITNNYGKAPGVCMRQDNRPDNSPILDPQYEARQIGLYEKNRQCVGAAYHVRFLNGPQFDRVVDTDRVLYRKYYYNGESHFDEMQLAVILAIVVVIVMLLASFCCFWYMTNGRPWRHFSGVMGRIISTNPLRWESEGVTPGNQVTGYDERQREIHELRRSQPGYTKIL